jgi:DNA-binding response OmpR family regulator
VRNEFILVADRSDGFVDSLKEALAATNYPLLHAKNREEAFYLLELLQSEIKLAIIELELPLLSGLDLIWRLVKRKQPKPLKIIATTSTGVLNGPLLENVVKELGVDAVVRKPIPPKKWRKTVEAVLAGQRPHMAASASSR